MTDLKEVNKQSSRDLSEILAKAGKNVDELIVELVDRHKSNYSFANTLLGNLLVKPDPKISDGGITLPQVIRTIKNVEAETESLEINTVSNEEDQ